LGVFYFSWNRPEGWQKRLDFLDKTFGTFFIINSFEAHPFDLPIITPPSAFSLEEDKKSPRDLRR